MSRPEFVNNLVTAVERYSVVVFSLSHFVLLKYKVSLCLSVTLHCLNFNWLWCDGLFLFSFKQASKSSMASCVVAILEESYWCTIEQVGIDN